MAEDTRARGLIVRAASVWVAMLLLTCCSIAAAFLLDGLLATAVPLGMSVLTGCVVALAFMQVQKADVVSRISAGVALAFLGVLFALSFADELTRSHIPPTFQPED